MGKIGQRITVAPFTTFAPSGHTDGAKEIEPGIPLKNGIIVQPPDS
jgi:hypothetical protein